MSVADRTSGGVALLIDGENIPNQFAGKIITLSAKRGPLVVKRVYGNVTLIHGWEKAPGIRSIHTGTSKNSADMLLSIQAVELAHSSPVATFVIASSDGDFAHLAHHLVERGHTVVGIGEQKAPEAFRKACTHFEIVTPAPPCAMAKMSPLDQKIVALIRANGGGMRMSDLNAPMRNSHNFKISDHPREKTWRAYLLSRKDVYDCDPKGPEALVRLVLSE